MLAVGGAGNARMKNRHACGSSAACLLTLAPPTYLVLSGPYCVLTVCLRLLAFVAVGGSCCRYAVFTLIIFFTEVCSLRSAPSALASLARRILLAPRA